MGSLREYAEAEALGRGTIAKWRRILGIYDHRTLATFANLAISLSAQGKHVKAGQNAEAEQLLRKTLYLPRRALGPTREQTLRVFQNLRVPGSRLSRRNERPGDAQAVRHSRRGKRAAHFPAGRVTRTKTRLKHVNKRTNNCSACVCACACARLFSYGPVVSPTVSST